MKSLFAIGALGAALIAGATAAGAAPVSSQDQVFVTQAAQGGMAEVSAAKMALRKSTNPTVDAFAHRMIADHGKANAQLASIAKAQGLVPPTEIDQMDQTMADKLSTLSGKAFDDAYLKGQVVAHKRTIALFEKEAGEGQNAQIVSFVKQTLPTIKMHYAMANKDVAMM
jgi:putative membrane protein